MLVKYADDLHTKYFDGKLPATFDHIKLMCRIKAKYDYLVSKGTYGTLSPEQEQIIDLTAQLEQGSGETICHPRKWQAKSKQTHQHHLATHHRQTGPGKAIR